MVVIVVLSSGSGNGRSINFVLFDCVAIVCLFVCLPACLPVCLSHSAFWRINVFINFVVLSFCVSLSLCFGLNCCLLFVMHFSWLLISCNVGSIQPVHRRLYRAFLAAYPLLHALWEGSVLYFQLAFTFGRSRCHSPCLFLANLMLRNLTDEEIDAIQSTSVPLKTALSGKR